MPKLQTNSTAIAGSSPVTCSEVFWISVADRLPDDDMTVLIADTENDVTLGFHDGDSGWRYCSAGLVGDPVTHWAELPDPPNETSPSVGANEKAK
jgi:hypothetical protein